MTSPGRRERKKLATRRAIRHAALTLARERGVDGVTVEDIAEAADVSPRTFFNHFACKDDALVGADSGAWSRQLAAAVIARPQDEPPLTALRRAITESEALYTDQQRELVMTQQQLLRDNPSLLPRALRNFAIVEQVLSEALATRLGLDAEQHLEPSVLAALAAGVLRVAINRWTADSSRPPVELIDEAFDVLDARS